MHLGQRLKTPFKGISFRLYPGELIVAKAKLYQYKKCSTCVKATKFLDKQSVDYQSIDITEKPPCKTELEFMLKQYDGELKKLFNT